MSMANTMATKITSEEAAFKMDCQNAAMMFKDCEPSRFPRPPEWKELLVGRYCTGPSMDKINLVLAPALAACGMKVPMITGGRMCHIGGTLNTLEAIPGFSGHMTPERMREVLASVGCCFVRMDEERPAATSRIVEADPSGFITEGDVSLFAASVMMERFSEGISTVVVDARVDSCYCLHNKYDAERLAKLMMDQAGHYGMKAVGLVTSEDLMGFAVGDVLELEEAVRCLQGKGPNWMMLLVNRTGGEALKKAGKASSWETGEAMMKSVISDGTALSKFYDMLVAQGVADSVASSLCYATDDTWNVLTKPAYTTTLKCPQEGEFARGLPQKACAQAVHLLGGGRNRPENPARNPSSVGLEVIYVMPGQSVTKDTAFVVVHHSTPEVPRAVVDLLQDRIYIVPEIRWDPSRTLPCELIKVVE